MRNKYEFQEPLNEEPDGTYITCGQMQFYLNRKDGEELFSSGSEDFIEYYNLCRMYNMITDIMKVDESAAIMYWDDKKEVVSLGFPTDGKVALALGSVRQSTTEDTDLGFLGEDEDDDFGNGLY